MVLASLHAGKLPADTAGDQTNFTPIHRGHPLTKAHLIVSPTRNPVCDSANPARRAGRKQPEVGACVDLRIRFPLARANNITDSRRSLDRIRQQRIQSRSDLGNKPDTPVSGVGFPRKFVGPSGTVEAVAGRARTPARAPQVRHHPFVADNGMGTRVSVVFTANRDALR